MSELTQCNFCSLRQMKAEAKKTGMRVTLVPADGGGEDIYLHTPKTEPKKGRRVGWFMEVSDHCCC